MTMPQWLHIPKKGWDAFVSSDQRSATSYISQCNVIECTHMRSPSCVTGNPKIIGGTLENDIVSSL